MLRSTVAAIGMLLPAASAVAVDFVVPVNTPIADRTQDLWTARWWMWAASPSAGAMAVRDTTGTRCGEGQEGDVFFLAGTFERHPIERACTVPTGKHLFFPIITYIMMPEGSSGCESLSSSARAMTDEPAELFAELDGTAIAGLASRRLATEDCFNVNARGAGPRMMSASNGYWLMLKPLPRGRHTLHFGGRLPSLRQDVTYKLLVE